MAARSLVPRGLQAAALGLLLGAVVASPVLGYRQGPLGDRVGACGFGPSCWDINCHQSFPIDTTELPWRLEQESQPLPGAYVPGRRYPLKLTIDERSSPFASIWGFELAPLVDCPFGLRGGDLTAIDTGRTRRFEEAGIVYLSHRCTCPTEEPECCGFRPQSDPSLIEWSFLWDAPAPATGTVTFHMAFNAGNWDGTNGGDRITLGTAPIPEDLTCRPVITDLRIAKAECGAPGTQDLRMSWTAGGGPFRVRSTTDVASASPDPAQWRDDGTSACVPMPAEALVYYSVAEDCGSGAEGVH